MPGAKQQPKSEADLLQSLERALGERLPQAWQAHLTPQPGYGRRRPDATLRLRGPDGSESTLAVEAKMTLNARDVPAILARMTNFEREGRRPDEPGPPFVVSRYLAPRTREMLAEAGASYADATGNLRLLIDRPAVYVETRGASSDPWRAPEREMRTLRGKPAAKVARALVDFKPPVGVRELAQRAQTSLGSTYRTVDFLGREALLTRNQAGGIAEVAWRDTLLRWSEDYSFQEANTIYPAFDPRGPREVLEHLRLSQTQTPYAVTGSLSAMRLEQVTEPRLATIFTPDPSSLIAELNLREAVNPPNVLIAIPFEQLVFERATEEAGVSYTAASQTAVDLLTSPGRGPSEGEALLGWMAENEDAWRQ